MRSAGIQSFTTIFHLSTVEGIQCVSMPHQMIFKINHLYKIPKFNYLQLNVAIWNNIFEIESKIHSELMVGLICLAKKTKNQVEPFNFIIFYLFKKFKFDTLLYLYVFVISICMWLFNIFFEAV